MDTRYVRGHFFGWGRRDEHTMAPCTVVSCEASPIPSTFCDKDGVIRAHKYLAFILGRKEKKTLFAVLSPSPFSPPPPCLQMPLFFRCVTSTRCQFAFDILSAAGFVSFDFMLTPFSFDADSHACVSSIVAAASSLAFLARGLVCLFLFHFFSWRGTLAYDIHHTWYARVVGAFVTQ